MELFTRVMRSILRVSTFFLGILPPLPEGQKFIGGFPTPSGFFFRRFELTKRLEGGFHHVEDVGAPHRFGENVTISGSLEHGAHATRSDNAGTSRSRFQQYLGASCAADNLMRDGGAPAQDRSCRLLSAFGRLAHGIRHGVGLANSQTDVTAAVTDHNRHPELEAAAAFYDFRHASDLDDTLFELLLYTLKFSHFHSQALYHCSQISLENQARLAGAISQCFDTADIPETAAVEDDLGDTLFLGPFSEQFANQFGLLGLGLAIQLAVQFTVDGGGSSQGMPGFVIDHLSIGFRQAAENSQSRPVRCAVDILAHAAVSANSCFSTV